VAFAFVFGSFLNLKGEFPLFDAKSGILGQLFIASHFCFAFPDFRTIKNSFSSGKSSGWLIVAVAVGFLFVFPFFLPTVHFACNNHPDIPFGGFLLSSLFGSVFTWLVTSTLIFIFLFFGFYHFSGCHHHCGFCFLLGSRTTLMAGKYLALLPGTFSGFPVVAYPMA
jgi:hypothetical protein